VPSQSKSIADYFPSKILLLQAVYEWPVTHGNDKVGWDILKVSLFFNGGNSALSSWACHNLDYQVTQFHAPGTFIVEIMQRKEMITASKFSVDNFAEKREI